MKYYINTKFYEFEKPNKILGITFSYTKTIELVSIGIVSEDDRKYYAVNCDSNLLLSNVIPTSLKQNILPDLLNSPKEDFKSLDNIRTDLSTFLHNDWEPTFYAYYSDYDWIMFLSVLGGRKSIPHHYPKYCIGVKQKLDSKIKNINLTKECIGLKELDKYKKVTFDQKLKWVLSLPYYPKNKNKHNALSDAVFTRDLDLFIKKHWKK